MTLDIVIASILSLQPALSENTAVTHARAILETTADESDAAALVVTAHRESSFKLGCIVGLGGRGSYGLGVGYAHWACGPLKVQAMMAMQALYDKGWNWTEKGAFRGYVGAHSSKWPEVGVRLALWHVTRERLLCGCSI